MSEAAGRPGEARIDEDPFDGTDLEADTPGTASAVASDLAAYGLSLLAAWVLIWLGSFAAGLVSAGEGARRWGIAVVTSVAIYIYLKQTTRLRLENRRLQALDGLLRSTLRKRGGDIASDIADRRTD